ncbi:serine-tRNA ligase [Edhazardia aedis USNM 41457]|uniref:serine--tRNA ligase n=1 Tax=Edhazardia aedis (strain USNM 41457) TaxID=1003232 RepID=J9DR88_EDHAE|nr:serine-tRNA ligase [Edhazardia aedis USNM 41457]|eukprot:EJW03857.1 serine-tRNA ligase [Edhazardia aedis USNM 41457]
MIDIELIRNEKEAVAASEKARFRDPTKVETLFNMDCEWKKLRYTVDQLNKKLNTLQTAIKKMKKKEKKNIQSDGNNSSNNDLDSQNTEEDAELNELVANLNLESCDLVSERAKIKLDKEKKQEELKLMEKTIQSQLKSIGNILKPSVPISKNEDDNALVYRYRSERKLNKTLPFNVIMQKVNGCDTARGTKISGHRGYFLQNDIALLGMSLSRYAIDFMMERGYNLMQTPVFIQKDVMAKTAQLSDFDDQLYSMGDEYFLIATSEQPLTAYYSDEICKTPVKFVGQSLCFRKEAGAHGKDNHGIFRIHQFEKIEQLVICQDDESDSYFSEMIKNAMDFYKSLDISYNVVSIVSGELNDAAAIKYDLEAYFPHSDRFRELVSCSNCTDYQSRDLNVRVSHQKKFPHMLNCTVAAIQRALCCIVENYQTDSGIEVPDVLKGYMKKDFIPYVEDV